MGLISQFIATPADPEMARLTAMALGRGNLYISATSERMKSAYSAPQARHWVARAILCAGRRGDEAMGEELMLTPEMRGVNNIDARQVMATPGERFPNL